MFLCNECFYVLFQDCSISSHLCLFVCCSYITEVGHRNNMTICAKHGGNDHIYTSNGRGVKIYINTKANAPEEDFTLQYNGTIFNKQTQF